MNHLKQTPRFKQVDTYINNNKPCSARHNNDKAMTPNKIILPKINKRKYRSSNNTNHIAPYMNMIDSDNNNAIHYIINNIHELATNHLHKKKQFHNGGGGGRSCNSYHNIFHASNNNNNNNHNININDSLIYQIKPPNNC